MGTHAHTLFVSYFRDLLVDDVWKRADLANYHSEWTQNATYISREDADRQLSQMSTTELRDMCTSDVIYTMLQARTHIDDARPMLLNLLRDHEDEYRAMLDTDDGPPFYRNFLAIWCNDPPDMSDYVEMRALLLAYLSGADMTTRVCLKTTAKLNIATETAQQLTSDVADIKIMSTVTMSVVLLLLVSFTVRTVFRQYIIRKKE
jgi:hypothetical protein